MCDGGRMPPLVARRPGRPAVGPGGLDQRLAGAPVAGLGQPATPHLVAGRRLARHQPEIGHELARRGKAAGIADLDRQRGGVDQGEAAQRLQGVDQPGERPAGNKLGDVIGQPIAPRGGFVERL